MLAHNGLPTSQRTYGLIDEFRAQTEANLSKTRDQMLDVDRQIEALLQQRRQLELPEKEALKKILVCKVASSPFRRLSLDLLQEIGHFMLASDETGFNPCITLSHVSSSWRIALLGSPRLWTDLSLRLRDENLLKGQVLEYFGRAGVRPLKLEIERPTTRNWSPGWTDFFQWLLYTWPKIQQVKYLETPFPLPGWPETDKAVNFQCLESLVCHSSFRRNSSWDVSPLLGNKLPIFFSHAPRLFSLTVGRNLRCFPHEEFSFPWSQLTRLSLLEPITHNTWTEILAECIALECGWFSLFSRHAGHAIGTETASRTQTSLQKLRLSFIDYQGDAFQLLRTHIFENVAVLIIDSIKQNNLGEQYSLKSPFPSLDHLVLTNYECRSDKILPILLDNGDVSHVSLEMDAPPRLQIPFFRLCSTRITRVHMPHLSRINIIARNDNGIKVDYVKAFSDMVRAWFNSDTSNGDIQTQGSYSVQLRLLPTSVQFVPNFYKELEDCTERGLNLVVKADYVLAVGSLSIAPWYDQA
jgi:hypothetical protein